MKHYTIVSTWWFLGIQAINILLTILTKNYIVGGIIILATAIMGTIIIVLAGDDSDEGKDHP